LAGATEEQVKAAREGDAEAFSDDEATRRFLRLAEKITRHAYKVTDEDVDAVREAGWSDEEVLEAIHVAAEFNMIDRLADTLGLTADDMQADMERIRQAMGR
jgi:alkylhydroperoxidase family enzyme